MVEESRGMQTQSELRDALLGAEVIFAVKRRPHKLAAVLDAVPPGRRGHFERLVANVLGNSALDAGHAVAAGALSGAALAEVQAEFHLRQALSEFQIKDFYHRKRAMESIGQTYAWTEFQRDIQRLHNADAGWQYAWWDEKLAGLDGKLLGLIQASVPGWYVAPKAVSSRTYPLGAFDPDPQKTWLSAWKEQQLQHPQPRKPMDTTGHTAVSQSPIHAPDMDRIWNQGLENRPLPDGDTGFGSHW
jgi:hypothetical protein